MKLFWGIAADGSVMISDNEHCIKAGCGKSFAPFPAGKEGLYGHRQYSILFFFFPFLFCGYYWTKKLLNIFLVQGVCITVNVVWLALSTQ